MEVTSITAVGKIFLDIFSMARAARRDYEKGAGLFKPRLIADTRLSLNSLRARTHELSTAFRIGDEKTIQTAWTAFFSDLSRLSTSVEALNLNILEIYNPGFINKLTYGFDSDAILYSYFQSEINFDQTHEGIGRMEKLRRERLSADTEKALTDYNLWSHDLNSSLMETENSLPDFIANQDDCISQLEKLEQLLDEMSSMLAEFLRENWSPKDLT